MSLATLTERNMAVESHPPSETRESGHRSEVGQKLEQGW